MGKITLEFRGFKMEAILDDDNAEKVYNALPMFALDKGQKTLLDVKTSKPEEKKHIQKLIADREVNKFPTKEEIRDYIKSISPMYEFSLPLVCKHFIGFIPSSVIGQPERRIYDKMWDRLRKAKQIIAKEETGEWKSTTGEEGETIYRFEKTDQGVVSTNIINDDSQKE